MNSEFSGKRVGFVLTGSFCTFDSAFVILEELINLGADVTAIVSFATASIDTRFGNAADIKEKLEQLTKKPVISTIEGAEPIGPKKLFDLVVAVPATGNTIAKLAAGIADTPATMAIKSHLRNGRPVVLGISSNDALGSGAKNIGQLLAARNFYFIPFGQDDAFGKPRSIVFKPEKTIEALKSALVGEQVQPILA